MNPTAEPQWHPITTLPALVPQYIRDWLTTEISLTVRLQQLGGFQVHVLREAWGKALPSEGAMLGISTDSKAWQRDVMLCVNEQPWVVAHSIIPEATLQAIPELKQLGDSSLGDLMFKTLYAKRQCLEFAYLSPTDALLAFTPLSQMQIRIWARRSLLIARGHKMIVNEVFGGVNFLRNLKE